jgi:hypothetical protein
MHLQCERHMCECGLPGPEGLSHLGSPERLPPPPPSGSCLVTRVKLLRTSGDSQWTHVTAYLLRPMDDHESDGRGFSRLTRLRHQFGHVLSHDHDHAPAPAVLDTGAVGIRATKVSLVGLGITALIQAVIVVVSGSVALLSDTIHNLTDALTASRCGSRSQWADGPQPRGTPTVSTGPRTGPGIVIVIAIARTRHLGVGATTRRTPTHRPDPLGDRRRDHRRTRKRTRRPLPDQSRPNDRIRGTDHRRPPRPHRRPHLTRRRRRASNTGVPEGCPLPMESRQEVRYSRRRS